MNHIALLVTFVDAQSIARPCKARYLEALYLIRVWDSGSTAPYYAHSLLIVGSPTRGQEQAQSLNLRPLEVAPQPDCIDL
jgi:hypothetical protein